MVRRSTLAILGLLLFGAAWPAPAGAEEDRRAPSKRFQFCNAPWCADREQNCHRKCDAFFDPVEQLLERWQCHNECDRVLDPCIGCCLRGGDRKECDPDLPALIPQ